ncbi:MAG: NAD(P)-dependent oxidoreductase [Myxococcaceae bacterium]|jgi:3-hydroxyisobutyrate dehydrogenase-like beta-hydroxyacid dehydrogenase|nr:NAD(P)-dependent oxidoreductase [Myxococcaceae bacterium]
MSTRHVGFLGLGLMGSRMAKNLKAKGFEVTVWNRTRARADELAPLGLHVASTPAEVATVADVLCTCVADVPALREVALGAQGLLSTARSGQLFIDFSTVSVPLVRELGAAFGAKGVDVIDAPVTGSKNGAEKGTLVIMAGGSDAAMARADAVFKAVGEKVIHCGPLGAGTQVKLAGNGLIAAMLQAFSEGLLLTSKAGVDPRKFIEVVQASGFRSPYFDFKGKALLERDFSTHFEVDLMHKDLTLLLENAAANRVPTPTAASVREAYALARAAGKGQDDIGAVITTFEALCGHRIGDRGEE